jgi:hypothetical protein
MITKDQLFLRTVEDLEARIDGAPDEYEILMAAGLLRKLLLDGSRLMDQVNRYRQIPVNFRIVIRDSSPLPGELPPVLWVLPSGLDPDATDVQTPPSIEEVSRDRFLKRPVAVYAGESATVKDLILYHAHIAGAVHAGDPKNPKDYAIAVLERMSWEDTTMSLEVIRSIGRIVVKALRPLVLAIENGS